MINVLTKSSLPFRRAKWRGTEVTEGSRVLAEETAIAITYNRVTYAVMMATPDDLHDFAVGFSLSEGVTSSVGAIEDFAVVEAENGLELRMWIAADVMARLEGRKRRLAGATGCGLCGLESLDEAMRPVMPVPQGLMFDPEQIASAAASLSEAQTLNHATRAVHAAGFWTEAQGLMVAREDVGRHNALDKLAGALARKGVAAETGILLLTSRISIELVQKAARMGAPILVAVSAPTALAVRAAGTAGMTLVGVARIDGFEVFTRADRVRLPLPPAAARAG